jgi:mRNA interferase MazF
MAATSLSTDVGPTTQPKRGEVWNVNFDPSVGAEIRKIRPAVVISSDAVGRLPIKIVTPLTEWKVHFRSNVWHVRLDPDGNNGVTKSSAVDALQVKSVAVDRFVTRLGRCSAAVVEEIVAAVALVIEYE